ncbi:MAG: hypothetical protein ACOYLH_02725 [Flavobacteriales bacterium]
MKGYYIDRVSHSSFKSAETEEHIHDKEQSPSYVEAASTAECSALDESLSSQTLSTQHELEEAEKSGLIKQVKRNKYRIAPKSIQGSIRHHMCFQTPLKSPETAKKEGDVLDVATVIFGMFFLISLAFAVLFFIAALFAKDALSLAVFLFIGGSFFVISLVFMVIWLLLRRKSAGKG